LLDDGVHVVMWMCWTVGVPDKADSEIAARYCTIHQNLICSLQEGKPPSVQHGPEVHDVH